MQATGSEEFRQALAPTISAVRDLADAVNECAGRHGHKLSASSRAMEEIAVEATFAARSEGWQEPVRDTHTFGGMTLVAAADFARSFAVLLDADSTPVYGHMVVARSVLDACVVAAWLNDPRVDLQRWRSRLPSVRISRAVSPGLIVSALSSAAASPRSTVRRCAASASSRCLSTTPSSGTSATSPRTSSA
ncbi:MAG: hypothetical protein WAN93_13470 [Solirubrobacteraceae bacterium]